MNAVLAQRKYCLGLRWSAEVGRTFGLWALIAFAALQATQIGFRLAVGFEGDYSPYLLRYAPFVLTAVGWVYLLKAFPLAITAGMTRKELFAAFAVFGSVVIAGTVVFFELVRLSYNLLGAGEFGPLDLGGAALLETLILTAVYFSAGAAAGAVMARFNGRTLGVVLAALLVGTLIFRTIPFQLLFTEFAVGTTFEIEFPGSEELFAPMDAVLTVGFVLIVWLALVRAPLPAKKA